MRYPLVKGNQIANAPVYKGVDPRGEMRIKLKYLLDTYGENSFEYTHYVLEQMHWKRKWKELFKK